MKILVIQRNLAKLFQNITEDRKNGFANNKDKRIHSNMNSFFIE